MKRKMRITKAEEVSVNSHSTVELKYSFYLNLQVHSTNPANYIYVFNEGLRAITVSP